ncbi:hypothetical protein GCM10010182_00370 [Actinomadura cremea]|nr:hypothetical protein GCM10010182_00370 [Actinomadura cremea]
MKSVLALRGPSHRAVPKHDIPQFTVRQLSEDQWEAEVTYELTDFMLSVGGRAVPHAETVSDLELIAVAERGRASIGRAAEAQLRKEYRP